MHSQFLSLTHINSLNIIRTFLISKKKMNFWLKSKYHKKIYDPWQWIIIIVIVVMVIMVIIIIIHHDHDDHYPCHHHHHHHHYHLQFSTSIFRSGCCPCPIQWNWQRQATMALQVSVLQANASQPTFTENQSWHIHTMSFYAFLSLCGPKAVSL